MDAFESKGNSYNMTPTGIAIGHITRVFPKERYCEVKTYAGPPSLTNLYLPKCQWLSVDSGVDGDEMTSIPKKGSHCLVFVVSGQGFIWGFFRPTDEDGLAANYNAKTVLGEGDKIMSTAGGSYVAVKNSGAVEIKSTNFLRRVMSPKDGLMADLCESYNLGADGGRITWEMLDKFTNSTLYKAEYRKDLARSTCLVDEIGSVDLSTIRRTTVGPILPGEEEVLTPVYKMTQDITGKTIHEVGLEGTGVTTTLEPTGAASVKNLLASAEITAAGDINVKGPVGSAAISSSGAIEIKNAVATIKATDSGDIEVSGPVGKFKMDKMGKIGLGSSTAELLDLMDQFLDAFINQTQLAMGANGPTGPLLPPAMSKLMEIKTKLTTIKGSV